MAYTYAVHAVERGRAPADLPRSTRILHTVSFDVTAIPSKPISVGLRVEILSLRRMENWETGREENEAQAWYAYSPADIVGEVVGIRTMELAVTEFIVLNEVPQSMVEYAYLTVQHIHGVTVHLDPWRRILRTLLLPTLPHTRHVPIQWNAVMVPDDEDDL